MGEEGVNEMRVQAVVDGVKWVIMNEGQWEEGAGSGGVCVCARGRRGVIERRMQAFGLRGGGFSGRRGSVEEGARE